MESLKSYLSIYQKEIDSIIEHMEIVLTKSEKRIFPGIFVTVNFHIDVRKYNTVVSIGVLLYGTIYIQPT